MALTPLAITLVILSLMALSLRDPIWGVAAYLAIYLLFNPNVWWGSILFDYLLQRPSFIATIFIVLGVVIHAGKLNWKINRIETLIYIFIVFCWVVSFFSELGIGEENRQYLIKITKIGIFLFLMIRSVRTMRHFNIVLITAFLCAVFVSQQAHVVGQYSSGRLDNIGGIDFAEANGLAAFLSIGLFYAGFRLIKAKMIVKLLLIGSIGIILNTIIMTQSRGVFLGMAAAGLYTVVQMPRKYRLSIGICMLLGLFMIGILMDSSYFERMGTIKELSGRISGETTENVSETERLIVWSASLKMFKDHPFGVGVKNFNKLIPSYDHRLRNIDAHNTYILCSTELGFLGLILLLSIIYFTYRNLMQLKKFKTDTEHFSYTSLTIMILGNSLVVFLTGYSMTHSCLYSEIFWILLVLPAVLKEIVIAGTNNRLTDPGLVSPPLGTKEESASSSS